MTQKYNKPFESSDMDYVNQSSVGVELRQTVQELNAKGLITTSAGYLPGPAYQYSFSPEYLWGYSRIFEICLGNFQKGQKALDAGGASSPIVFYCGKKGIDITTVDQQESLVENTKKVANIMRWENIKALKGDFTELAFPDNFFDAVFSVAVLQFFAPEIKIKAVRELSRVLKPGGTLGLIIDFGRGTGKKANYANEHYESFHRPFQNTGEIEKYIIGPSGLTIYGNRDMANAFTIDKREIRKAMLSDFLKGKSFKRRLALPYLFFKSPYFDYTFYSIFLKKSPHHNEL